MEQRKKKVKSLMEVLSMIYIIVDSIYLNISLPKI